MENKQTFGAFICQRRKDLGMTQKEFAARLFVTDSSVSKWERGLAYPDITLLQSICQVLQISEKELLNASEDMEGRRVEQLAKKYLREDNYNISQISEILGYSGIHYFSRQFKKVTGMSPTEYSISIKAMVTNL